MSEEFLHAARNDPKHAGDELVMPIPPKEEEMESVQIEHTTHNATLSLRHLPTPNAHETTQDRDETAGMEGYHEVIPASSLSPSLGSFSVVAGADEEGVEVAGSSSGSPAALNEFSAAVGDSKTDLQHAALPLFVEEEGGGAEVHQVPESVPVEEAPESSAAVLADARHTITLLVEEIQRLQGELEALRFGQQQSVCYVAGSYAASHSMTTAPAQNHSHGQLPSSSSSTVPDSINGLKRTVQVRNRTIQALQKQLQTSQEQEKRTHAKWMESQQENETLRRRENIWSKELQSARRENANAAMQAAAWKSTLDEMSSFVLATLQRWKSHGGDPATDAISVAATEVGILGGNTPYSQQCAEEKR